MIIPKSRIKAEMVASGRWDEFVKLREGKKAAGVGIEDAWMQAYEFVRSGAAAATAGESEQPKAQAVDTLQGEAVDAGAIPAKQFDAKVESLPAPGPVIRFSPPAVSVPVLFSKDRVEKAFGKKVKATKRQEDEWVEANVDVAVELEDAPSMGAWSRLMRVRSSPELMRDFYRAMMAVRGQREETDKFEDDGRDNIELIERCEHAIHASGAEGVGGESEVSAEGD